MSQQAYQTAKRHWFPLPVRISLGLVGAAIIPLFVMLAFTNMQTRPALVDQANKAMTSDAQTRVQLIDTYFGERIADTLTVVQVPSLLDFLQLPKPPDTNVTDYQTAALHAAYALQAAIVRDANYRDVTLFDMNGDVLLNAPQNMEPGKHGQDYVPATYLTKVRAGNAFVSPVYATSNGKSATVDIYAPAIAPMTADNSKPPVIGFVRATLKLSYIWDKVVQKDAGSNGDGSYAFILDENGIRIADTNPARRFTSVEALGADVQQQIRQEQRFGNQQNIAILPDQRVAASVNQRTTSDTFQTQPAEQNEQFQVVRQDTANAYVHWHYFVLSPVATVTAVANQQLLSITFVAVLASLIVALMGWFVGRGMARPILRAVANLRESSTALNTLATNQQEGASEQVWVVDSSQIGLQSVQYYTEAARVALSQLEEVATKLAQRWRESDPQKVDQALEQALKAIRYLENAMEYQYSSNQKLGTALKVATQVTEQLHQGALSATEAAAQLEDVVQRLLAVAGQ